MSVHDFRWMEREHTDEHQAGANQERAAIVAYVRKRLGHGHILAGLIERGEHLRPAQSDASLLINIFSADDAD